MFAPVKVGHTGRRAVAWFVRNGVVCSATDANAAAHAMAVVLEALARTERSQNNEHLVRMAESLLVRFPDRPGTYREHTEGQIDVQVNLDGIGYGYVRPTPEGFECGGALFDGVSRTAQVIGPHAVALADAGRTRESPPDARRQAGRSRDS